MKTAQEVRNLMPMWLTVEDKLESIMFQIEDAAKRGHLRIVSNTFHDGNEMKELIKELKRLGFKVEDFGFQLHVSWDI